MWQILHTHSSPWLPQMPLLLPLLVWLLRPFFHLLLVWLLWLHQRSLNSVRSVLIGTTCVGNSCVCLPTRLIVFHTSLTKLCQCHRRRHKVQSRAMVGAQIHIIAPRKHLLTV